MKRPQKAKRAGGPRFVVCVRNEDYEASLELNEIYRTVPDTDAQRDGDIRIIDESGEDYLFSADRFVTIEAQSHWKRC